MKRKVNRVGINTLTVSLPSKWAERNKIKQGDEVEVEEKEGHLVLSTELKGEDKEITIHIADDSAKYTQSHISRLYRYGYSKIIITYEDPDVLSNIKNVVNNLIGADIIDASMNRCVIRIFPIDEKELDFDQILAKMIYTLKYTFDTLKKDINDNKFRSEKTIIELRDTNWKLKDYILRKAYVKRIDYEEYSILNHLSFCYEKVGTNVKGFYKMHLKNNRKIKNSKKPDEAISKINNILDWIVLHIQSKREFTNTEEAKFRDDIRKYYNNLLDDLNNDKTTDRDLLSLLYLSMELLNASISYLYVYKNKN